MNDEPKPARPSRSWLQISLSTLLALILGFGAGLAVRHRFGEEPNRLPNPSGIRLGDKLTVEMGAPAFATPPPARTVLVLADGTISLPKLGQVPAAGRSLDQLTADLTARYAAYYKDYSLFDLWVFVSFSDTSVNK